MGTENFQLHKLDLEKAEEPEIKLPTSVHVLLKPGLENFEHTSLACEMSAIVR